MNLSWIPLRGILLNLNLFFTPPSAVTGQDILEAIKNGNLAAIQEFIEAGVNFNWPITADCTPLTYATDYNRIEIARAILAAPGTDINYPSTNGHTPIHYAVQQGSDEMIRLLLADERCARNHVSVIGRTPLHIAVSERRTSTVLTLLEDPTVDRNIANIYGKTALDYAIEFDHFDTVIVLLNDPLVVKDRIDRNRRTILHKIVQLLDSDELSRANRLRILEAILGVGIIDVNHQDLEGKTALHFAAEFGDPEVILKLTAAGADSAIEDESGQNAVEYALMRERALEPIYLEALDYAFNCSLVGLK